MRATTVEEILRHCDRYRVTEASGGVPEYFFDRNYTRNDRVPDGWMQGWIEDLMQSRKKTGTG